MLDPQTAATQDSAPPPVARTKREVAIAALRAAIEEGRYRPGQELSQRQIAEDLGLSTTPVREAILELLARRLLVRASHHSVRVAAIEPARLRDFYAVRRLVEGEALRLALPRLTPAALAELHAIQAALADAARRGDLTTVQAGDRRFHARLYAECGNPVLVETLDKLRDSLPLLTLWRRPGRVAASLAEHAALLAALARRDEAAAVAALETHLASGLASIEAFLEDRGESAPVS